MLNGAGVLFITISILLSGATACNETISGVHDLQTTSVTSSSVAQASPTPMTTSLHFSVVPTTSLATETGNNTSAANNFNSLWASQAARTTGVPLANGNKLANTSKINIKTLLYPGSTSEVYAHLMAWFGPTNHFNVGYRSDDAAQIHAQIQDMISRGVSGTITDWYGPGSESDTAQQLLMADLSGSNTHFKFDIMIDQGAINCAGISSDDCVVSRVNYVMSTYAPNSNYMKDSSGKPIITFFLSYGSYNWPYIVARLIGSPKLVFENNGGLTDPNSSGGFAWVQPTALGTSNDYGMSYLNSFYQTTLSNPVKISFAATYKGFTDQPVDGWGSGTRQVGQQCGQTWLQTFNQINNNFSVSKQLDKLQIVTWNDYEEGTALETGIDNCLSVAGQVSGSTLSWSTVGAGNVNTIDHFSIYISNDGINLMSLDPYLGKQNNSSTSLLLDSLNLAPGNYKLFVQAVGKPFIHNQLSAAIAYHR